MAEVAHETMPSEEGALNAFDVYLCFHVSPFPPLRAVPQALETLAAAAAAAPQESVTWDQIKQHVLYAVHEGLSGNSARPSELQEMIAAEAEKRHFTIKLEDRSVGRLPADSKRAWVMCEWYSWQESIVPKSKRVPTAADSTESAKPESKRRKTEDTKESKLKQFKQSLELTFGLFEELRGKPMHHVRREVVESMFHS